MLSFSFPNTALLKYTRGFLQTDACTQANEFTIIPVNKFIPALRPCATKENCFESAQSCMSGTGCKVAVPYSFDTTPWSNIPAVVTDRYAFWITNPSMAMYDAWGIHCRGGQGVFAMMPESSYQSIQVWRFDPYEFCPVGADGIRKCPQDTSARYTLLPGFISRKDEEGMCNQAFYVIAPTISYLDESNLVITVLNTTFGNLNHKTLRPINASLAKYVDPPPPDDHMLLTALRPLMITRSELLLLFFFVFHPLALDLILLVIHVEFERFQHLIHVIV